MLLAKRTFFALNIGNSIFQILLLFFKLTNWNSLDFNKLDRFMKLVHYFMFAKIGQLNKIKIGFFLSVIWSDEKEWSLFWICLNDLYFFQIQSDKSKLKVCSKLWTQSLFFCCDLDPRLHSTNEYFSGS